MWMTLFGLFFYVLPNMCARSLRKNPDLLSFNTDINANITAKIQDEAVIISLLRESYVDDDITKEHILFGFDIFNFVPQNFRVSVNYPKKKIFLNLTSTLNSYSIEYDLKTSKTIKSLFLRLNDEDDTIFLVVNCDSSSSVVTPINIIKFFRIAAVNKFKILFNKRYELKVYTEDDDMEGKIQETCNIKDVIPEGRQEFHLELDKLATHLVKFTPHLFSFLYSSENESELSLEIFLKAFLSKDVVHKTSNVYRLVHLIQTLTNSFSEIYQHELQVLLSKIFWTQGKEHHYVRKWRPNYFNDVNIKNEVINILFADSPKTFLDSLRSLTKIGQKFREVFANPQISINEVMRNDSNLKDTLLDVIFQKPLDKDQLNFLNPNHIIKKMFANYYLRDLSVNPKILNTIHKHIIFRADQQDYITIGKFFRYVFFKDSGFLHANIFLESDLVIGMRVVYVLSSGQVDEKREIYWTARNLITKKDVELPKALEYPESIITNTLRKCYGNPEMSRYIFMQTLENLFIYNNPKIGSFLDHNQGAFIYNLYRDLILNDIQKEKSVLKSVLLSASFRIQAMIGSMIQSVVANVGNVKELRQIAVNFVNDTLSYAKIDAYDAVKTEDDYVQIFEKIVGKASATSDKQKKINFKINLLKFKFEKQDSDFDAVEQALSQSNLKVNGEVESRLKEIYKKYGTSADTLVRKIDEILENRYTMQKEFEDIVAQDLNEGVTFDNKPLTNDSIPLFVSDGDEDESITKERQDKMLELNILEDWYTEQAKYYSTPGKSKDNSENEQTEFITDTVMYDDNYGILSRSKTSENNGGKYAVTQQRKNTQEKKQKPSNGTFGGMSEEKNKKSTTTPTKPLKSSRKHINTVNQKKINGLEKNTTSSLVIIDKVTLINKNKEGTRIDEAVSRVKAAQTHKTAVQTNKKAAQTIKKAAQTNKKVAVSEKKDDSRNNDKINSKINAGKVIVTVKDKVKIKTDGAISQGKTLQTNKNKAAVNKAKKQSNKIKKASSELISNKVANADKNKSGTNDEAASPVKGLQMNKNKDAIAIGKKIVNGGMETKRVPSRVDNLVKKNIVTKTSVTSDKKGNINKENTRVTTYMNATVPKGKNVEKIITIVGSPADINLKRGALSKLTKESRRNNGSTSQVRI